MFHVEHIANFAPGIQTIIAEHLTPHLPRVQTEWS
jgi:hypothetical protein